MTAETHDVGSLGEEAAKLIAALSDWASDGGAGQGDPLGALREVDRHVATGSAECRYCPVCQVVAGVRGVVRDIDPEVRDHLTTAASSLVQAVTSLVAGPPPQRPTTE